MTDTEQFITALADSLAEHLHHYTLKITEGWLGTGKYTLDIRPPPTIDTHTLKPTPHRTRYYIIIEQDKLIIWFTHANNPFCYLNPTFLIQWTITNPNFDPTQEVKRAIQICTNNSHLLDIRSNEPLIQIQQLIADTPNPRR